MLATTSLLAVRASPSLANVRATASSVVVDINPYSTPPLIQTDETTGRQCSKHEQTKATLIATVRKGMEKKHLLAPDIQLVLLSERLWQLHPADAAIHLDRWLQLRKLEHSRVEHM